MSDDFTIEVEEAVGSITIRPIGDLDLASSSRLTTTIDDLDGVPSMIDLGAVSFIDSSGLRALIQAHRKGVGLSNASESVQRLFELTALDHLLGQNED